jgi:hypothetical protein
VPRTDLRGVPIGYEWEQAPASGEAAPERRRPAGERLSEGFGEPELKVVRTLSVGDLDRHLAGNTYQLTAARIWHHRDGLLPRTAGHGAAALQREAATAPAQRTGVLSEELG